MGPDIKADAFRLKVALEKADAENSHSGVRDVLQALLALPGMTEAVIRETKLGKALAGTVRTTLSAARAGVPRVEGFNPSTTALLKKYVQTNKIYIQKSSLTRLNFHFI